jgi:hypothetical protein
MRDAKTLSRCIYCPRPPDGEEHWLPRSFGAFRGNSLLKGRICTECNARLGRTFDHGRVDLGVSHELRDHLGRHTLIVRPGGVRSPEREPRRARTSDA